MKQMKMKTHGVPRRLGALLLSLCMTVSMFGGFGALPAQAAAAPAPGPTEHILANSRKADPDTMDTYMGKLLSDENGSRYAGRVWTDKTVFAYNDGEGYIPRRILTAQTPSR